VKNKVKNMEFREEIERGRGWARSRVGTVKRQNAMGRESAMGKKEGKEEEERLRLATGVAIAPPVVASLAIGGRIGNGTLSPPPGNAPFFSGRKAMAPHQCDDGYRRHVTPTLRNFFRKVLANTSSLFNSNTKKRVQVGL